MALAAQHGEAIKEQAAGVCFPAAGLPWRPLPPEAFLYVCTRLVWCSGWGTAVVFSLTQGYVHLTR